MTVELRDTLTAHELMATNREAWLRGVAHRIVEDIMQPNGYGFHADLRKLKDDVESVEGKDYADEDTVPVPLTAKLNVSCSWPHKGGVARKLRVVGQCWSNAQSTAGDAELFISPTIGDGFKAAEVLVHELAHAAVGTKQKHNRRFARACVVLGLEGKPTATYAGEGLAQDLRALLLGFPEYPHAALQYVAPLKSEKSRQLKVFCKIDECPSQEEKGFKFRLTKSWIDKLSAGLDGEEDLRLVMVCPFCNNELAVELPIDEREDV